MINRACNGLHPVAVQVVFEVEFDLRLVPLLSQSYFASCMAIGMA